MRLTEENIARISEWSDQELDRLMETLEKHPYSSSLSVMLTKALEQRGGARYEDIIQRSALLTYSRKQLHDFLFDSQDETAPHLPVEEAPTAEEDEAIELVHRVDEEAQATEELPTQAEKPVEVDETEQDDDPLESMYLSEALQAGLAIDLIDRIDERAEVSQREEEPPSSSNQDEAPQADPLPPNESLESEEATPIPVETVRDRMRFSDWMNALSEDAIEVQDEKYASSQSGPTPASFKEAASIVDSFIEKENDIVPKRAEFFNPAKAAKSSIQDREEIVTETLAQVYASQGNVGKAISTYEKLSLLHPEKSSYFAGLISTLKKQDKK